MTSEISPTTNYSSDMAYSASALPGLFISHGSPMLALQQDAVTDALIRLSHNLPRPRAIVVMSAHWVQPALAVSTATRPATWHDFNGFPAPLYQLQYPAPGHVELAEHIIELLQQQPLPVVGDSQRPRDHGVWMPLLHLYPEADIPVVQIAIPGRATARQIYQIGQLLVPLRQQGILLIGSGSITHNLAELDWRGEGSAVPAWASRFRNQVAQLLQAGDYEHVLDYQQLDDWQRNHPTIEHLQPLFFTMGTGHRMNIVHSSFAMGALGMDIYRFD